MKYFSLLASAVALLFPGVSAAQSAGNTVVVTGRPVTFARWSSDVTRNIERHLIYPTPFANELPATGLVSIKFHCGEDGRPAAVTLFRKSGSHYLDSAAMYAVSRIKTLHPMPASFRTGQTFVANILFATDWADYDSQMTALRKEALQRNARYSDDGQAIALTIGAGAGAGQ